MYFGTITGTIAVLAIIFVLELLFVIPNNIGILVILGLIIAIILVFNAIISPVFRFHRYRYKIDEESIDIIEGYVFTQRNIVFYTILLCIFLDTATLYVLELHDVIELLAVDSVWVVDVTV